MGTVVGGSCKMDSGAAQEQVVRMKDFIIHEAGEKAGEIDAKAEEDYQVEKQRQTEDAKLVINKEFKSRMDNAATQAQISAATETNKSKLQVLTSAAGAVYETFEATCNALSKVTEGGDYQTLLTNLIKQGAALLDGKSGKVRCREQDKAAVGAAISAAGVDMELTISDNYLTKDTWTTDIAQMNSDIIGGVLVQSDDGKIMVNQTLNSRLQVAYDNALPAIKPMLFNQLGSKHVS